MTINAYHISGVTDKGRQHTKVNTTRYSRREIKYGTDCYCRKKSNYATNYYYSFL